MKDYILCSLFWVIFTLFIYGTGRAFAKEKKSEAYAFTTGYLIYSVPVAIGGIIVQIIGLPWMVFSVYVGVIWFVLLGCMIFLWKKKGIRIFTNGLKDYVKENWVIYAILAILVGMMFFYYKGFWLGNHMDDGYYITKVAVLPYTQDGYSVNYPVGIAKSGLDSYVFNTWEIEASVYVKLLGVQPTLFLRLFQSVFYYFLFLNIVKAFSESVLQKLAIKLEKSMYQYPVLITLLFGMYYIFLAESGLLPLRDTFHFNTGIFLGVTLPKMLAVLLLLFYYLDAKKLSIKMFLGVGAVSLVMMSKTSVVLPVIIITSFSYLVIWLFLNKGKREKILAVAALGGYLAISLVLPGSSQAQDTVFSEVMLTLKSPVVIGCCIIFLCSFLLKERMINLINGVLIMSLLLMLVPGLNNIFETSSIYIFVAGRAWTTWVYTLIIVSSIYLCAMLSRLNIKSLFIQGAYIVLGILLTAGIIFGFDLSGDTLVTGEEVQSTDVKNCLRVIRQNKYFVPNSTMVLGNALKELSDGSEEQLYVAAPDWVNVDGTLHGPAVMLRTYAPDIVSVSATVRYFADKDSPLLNYDQEKYTQFISDPSEQTAAGFDYEAKNVGVNCVIVQNQECAKWLEGMGYELYTATEDSTYFIWTYGL